MKKTNKMSNGEFLRYLDNFAHPLAGIFIIEAISRACKDVMDNQDEIMEEERRSIIAPAAWIECAKTLKEELHKRHES